MPASRRRFMKHLAGIPAAAASASPLLRSLDSLTGGRLTSPSAGDPLRPQFHLLPAKNWMNDPNGPIFWKGFYHMFFQYNPGAAVWGDMHWAHAVSPDMLHWRHMPIALAPTAGWDDSEGCFTGSAVDDHGTATVVYTGVKTVPPDRATLRDGHSNFREVQCLATSTDSDLRTWTKWRTPIIQPPDDPKLTGFRDPFLWREGEVWYLGVGSGVEKEGGRVLLYRSKDLRQWEYLHPLTTGKWTGRENSNPVDSGEMWECPDFFPLGQKHVLLYSTAGRVAWEVGSLDRKEMVFHRERDGVLDHGAYYAQKTQLDAKENRILWGWIPERRPDSELVAAGWAGCMALPRILSLTAQNDLEMRVAPVAESLRERQLCKMTAKDSAAENARKISSLEIANITGELRWGVAKAPFSMVVADSDGPWWSLRLLTAESTVTLEVNHQKIELPGPAPADMQFRLWLDGSVAEMFCNDLHVVTSRIYRKPSGNLRVQLPGADPAALTNFEAWQLKPISKDRLTT